MTATSLASLLLRRCRNCTPVQVVDNAWNPPLYDAAPSFISKHNQLLVDTFTKYKLKPCIHTVKKVASDKRQDHLVSAQPGH